MADEEENVNYNALLNMVLGGGSAPSTFDLDSTKETNKMQDVMAMLSDPSLAMFAPLFGMEDIMGYEQFGGGEPSVEMPAAPIVYTPRLDALSGSDDPALQKAADDLRAGRSPAQIAADFDAYVEAGSMTENQAKAYRDEISSAFTEHSDSERTRLEYEQQVATAQAAPPEQTELEKAFAKAGFTSPTQQYTPEFVDPRLPTLQGNAQQLFEQFRASREGDLAREETVDAGIGPESTGANELAKRAMEAAAMAEMQPEVDKAQSYQDEVMKAVAGRRSGGRLTENAPQDPTAEFSSRPGEAWMPVAEAAAAAPAPPRQQHRADDPQLNSAMTMLQDVIGRQRQHATSAGQNYRSENPLPRQRFEESAQTKRAGAQWRNAREESVRAQGKADSRSDWMQRRGRTPHGDQVQQRVMLMRALGLPI